jgi:DNA-directed RNA polymerase
MDQMTAETSVELEAARARFFKQSDRAEKNFGYGATNEALHIAQGCYERLAAAMELEMDKPLPAKTGPKDLDDASLRLMKTIPPQIIALVVLNATLRGVMDEEGFTSIAERVGEQLRHELFSVQLEAHDEKLKAKIERWVKEKHGNLKYRLQAARSAAKKEGFSFVSRWKAGQHVAIGTFALNVLLVTLPDLFNDFIHGDKRMIEVTEGASALAEQAIQQHVRRYPVFLPSEEPPEPWTDFTGGGPVDPIARGLATLVRTRHRETIRAVKAAIKSGQMQPALDAVNTVQAVPWKINTHILSVIRECKRRGIEVDGLPPDSDFVLPEPPKPWEELDDEEKKLVRVERAETKKENRALAGDRLRYDEDMVSAEALSGMEQFYIPHNLDWRGREYPLTTFNFQREDRVRALFLFKDGEPIGEEGIAWLKVHLANCGDFKAADGKKVSKKSYEERIKWVDENIGAIRDCAMQDWECSGPLTPEALSFWTQADKPFLFLAACVELTKALSFGPDYVCSLPCSWDGSCSGAQHLCAATRSEDAWKVNLTDLPEPNDLYIIVGNGAKEGMWLDLSNEVFFVQPKEDARGITTSEVASMVLAYDGDWRKVFKRNTMTTFYGSKGFGMAQQHMDDLMEPLRREVLRRKRTVHPFGKTYREQHAASRFLAMHASKTIAKELPLAMKAMEFLQDLAAVMAHAGKPLEWVTPVGLPWSNRYHAPVTEQLRLWMHDHGVRRPFRPLVATGHQKDIDKNRAKNGSAPNFVHACDAAHLLRTVNAARREGIIQFALVHDSFGSLPSHAARFQGIIREQFVEMYEQHDVLTEVLERATCDLNEHNNRLSELAEMRAELTGNLNIKEVLNAKYAFA